MRSGKPGLGKFPFSPPRADNQSILPSGHPCPEPQSPSPPGRQRRKGLRLLLATGVPCIPRQGSSYIKQEEPFPPQLIKTSGQRLQMKGPCQFISLANEATAQASFPLLNLINSAVDPGARGYSAPLVLRQVAGTFQLT